ncbi:MAG: phage tail sheath subtilisin-like domain-containing protein [Thermosipho sp. (in: Bacteria)]|nr:phage tail sheath subtilisin-like domain-containing protein [Thermosipho sp. (in: thermotogales)]
MQTLHPGLYFQEVKGTAPVEGTSTSIGAFVGTAIKGPIREAILVTNWTQFVETFGSFDTNSYLAYAVRQFFENGGTQAYIVRTVHYVSGVKQSDNAKADILDTLSNPLIKVEAKYDGTWGDNLSVEVVSFDSPNITLYVKENGEIVEKYESIDISTIEDEINNSSKYITVTYLDTGNDPQVGSVSLTGGVDGLIDITDTDYTDALQALDNKQINMVAIPGMTTNAIHTGLISYVESRKDCIAILDSPLGNTPSDILSYVNTNNLSSSYATLYYPWLKASDPIGIGKNPTKLLPPSGAIMGIYARIDSSRGIHKAPAGIEATVLGAIDLEYHVTDSEQDTLNPVGVNCIRVFEGRGIVVWGARTLSSDSEYKYINIRRHVMYVKASLLKNLDWVVFEPNDETLWGKIEVAVSDFLRNEWRNGALKGSDEQSAFYVKCDSEINTPETVDLGNVYIDIGLAEQKPSEFVVFRISLKR